MLVLFIILVNLPTNISQPNLWSQELSVQLHKYWQSSPKVGNLQATEQLKLWYPKGHSVKKCVNISSSWNLQFKEKEENLNLQSMCIYFHTLTYPCSRTNLNRNWDSPGTRNISWIKIHKWRCKDYILSMNLFWLI